MLIAAMAGIISAIALAMVIVFVVRKRRTARKRGYLAQYDPLTGLINRTLFQDRVNGALARARRDGGLVTIMFLDVDGFKDVNDRFGHAVGDELLRQVAGRLTGVLRESDTVARLGGDEFTVILEGGRRVEDAGRVATKILKTIASPYTVGSREMVITVSIGISMYPVDGDGYEELIAGADTAIIVISASAGIEVNTRRLFAAAGAAGKARAIVINKIDAENVALDILMGAITETFGTACKPMNLPTGECTGIVGCFMAVSSSPWLNPALKTTCLRATSPTSVPHANT